MGMSRTDYLIMGVRGEREELPLGYYADEYLPYIEGWENETLTMVGTEDDFVFIGRVVLEVSEGEYDEHEGRVVKMPDPGEVAEEISAKIGAPWYEKPVKLWHFYRYW